MYLPLPQNYEIKKPLPFLVKVFYTNKDLYQHAGKGLANNAMLPTKPRVTKLRNDDFAVKATPL